MKIDLSVTFLQLKQKDPSLDPAVGVAALTIISMLGVGCAGTSLRFTSQPAYLKEQVLDSLRYPASKKSEEQLRKVSSQIPTFGAYLYACRKHTWTHVHTHTCMLSFQSTREGRGKDKLFSVFLKGKWGTRKASLLKAKGEWIRISLVHN